MIAAIGLCEGPVCRANTGVRSAEEELETVASWGPKRTIQMDVVV
jgi:hypothetical protein